MNRRSKVALVLAILATIVGCSNEADDEREFPPGVAATAVFEGVSYGGAAVAQGTQGGDTSFLFNGLEIRDGLVAGTVPFSLVQQLDAASWSSSSYASYDAREDWFIGDATHHPGTVSLGDRLFAIRGLELDLREFNTFSAVVHVAESTSAETLEEMRAAEVFSFEISGVVESSCQVVLEDGSVRFSAPSEDGLGCP